MRRTLVRLYPEAWRERYGAEMEALMSDVPGGWRGNFDVLKGAMGMRLRYQSGPAIVLGLVIIGMLAGWLVSFAVPNQWEARAVMQMIPPQISENGNPEAENRRVVQEIQRLQSNVTSRQSLAMLINDPRLNLYSSERRTKPLEDVEDTMRQGIYIQVHPEKVSKRAAVIFSIGFAYPDPAKALDTVNALITRFIQESTTGIRASDRARTFFLETLDPPTVPKKPASPNRGTCTLIGAVGGLILAFTILIFRRPASAQGAGWDGSARRLVLGLTAAGLIVGGLVSFAVPTQYRAAAVMQATPAVVSLSTPQADLERGTQEAIQRFQSSVTSRKTLASLITDKRLDLYASERRSEPLEDIVDMMRRSIRIAIRPGSTKRGAAVFSIAFIYPDAAKAQDTVNGLIVMFIRASTEEYKYSDDGTARVTYGYMLDTLDPPALPLKPYAPNRAAIVLAGGIGGLTLAFIILVWRRLRTKEPGLQPA